MVKCEAGHDKHDTIEVDTILGKMIVWDYKKYMDFPGYCTGQDVLSESLDKGDCWEERLFARTKKILEDGDRSKFVFDIGAHVGWYSKFARSLGYQVFAYEGIPENIELLKKNAPGVNANHVWFDKASKALCGPTIPIEFMKIDIEGAEEHAIRYFEAFLPITENILIEVSPCFNDSYPALIRKLADMGFTVYEDDGGLFDFKYDFTQKDLFSRRDK